MRQARYTDDGLNVVDVEPPPLPDDWVRLNVASCGICGTDLHIYQQTAWYGRGVCPGHEFAGVIAEGGAGLADALYAVDPTIHCRTCEFCLGGMPQFCAGYRTIGIFVDGGAADSVVVPRYTLHPVDPSVPTARRIAGRAAGRRRAGDTRGAARTRQPRARARRRGHRTRDRPAGPRPGAPRCHHRALPPPTSLRRGTRTRSARRRRGRGLVGGQYARRRLRDRGRDGGHHSS